MRFVIVTGMSGAGKSTALKTLEDMGFFCVDNLPVMLIEKFAEIAHDDKLEVDNVAIGIDIRSGEALGELSECLQEMKKNNYNYEILFLDSSEVALVKRYKETRRKHPLDEKFNGNLHRAIKHEWEQLAQLREIADYYIETSNLSSNQLKEQVKELFLEKRSDSLTIKIMSFGFKYGVSTESDLVFDVRCLPNPFYIETLRPHTGCDECVRDYVMSFEQSKELFGKLRDLIDFLIPLYINEGKSQLVIAFGCTGGKHRSVTFAELMAKYLGEKDYKIQRFHRDITKDRKF